MFRTPGLVLTGSVSKSISRNDSKLTILLLFYGRGFDPDKLRFQIKNRNQSKLTM
jgi:hypothetical protein